MLQLQVAITLEGNSLSFAYCVSDPASMKSVGTQLMISIGARSEPVGSNMFLPNRNILALLEQASKTSLSFLFTTQESSFLFIKMLAYSIVYYGRHPVTSVGFR